jgi:hypothetical protein
VGVVVVIVLMLVVQGRWCIMFFFLEVEASEGGFEMAVFFPFKGSNGVGRLKCLYSWRFLGS